MSKEDKVEQKENRFEVMRKLLGKKGKSVYNLKEHNPADVKRWISTGSRWLDSIIASKKNLEYHNMERGGIPVGRITEIAGLESTGKSFLSFLMGANAQKMGIDLVYFDSESATDTSFIKRLGVDLEKILYLPATTIENVAETIDELLKENPNPMLFVLDSLANTPTIKELEKGDFNPQANIAIKPRVLSTVFAKLIDPIAQHGSTFIVVNQLKTNIDPSNPMVALTEPYIAPGGKATCFAYSLRLWLTSRKAKKWKIENEDGVRIGSDVKVDIKKSRFGSEGRKCNFKIYFNGDFLGVDDEESWFDACKFSKFFKPGAWNTLIYEDGTEEKFPAKGWKEKLQQEKFRNRVLEIMDEVLIK